MTQQTIPQTFTICDLCLDETEEAHLETFIIKAMYPYSGYLSNRLRICGTCKKVCIQLEHLKYLKVKSMHCPKCGSDMSAQSKRGSKEIPCAECYLTSLLEEQK